MQYKKHKYLEQKQDLRGIMQESNYFFFLFLFINYIIQEQICKQPDFLANDADLIDRREITVEILFCLMPTLENGLISTFLL